MLPQHSKTDATSSCCAVHSLPHVSPFFMCVPLVLQVSVICLICCCQAATAAEAGVSPSGPLPSQPSGGAPGQELGSASDGRSGELRALSASGSDAVSNMHGGYGGGLDGMGASGGGGGGSMAAGSSMASLYPGGSVRSASGRLLPAGDGGAGVQVSTTAAISSLSSCWCHCMLPLLCQSAAWRSRLAISTESQHSVQRCICPHEPGSTGGDVWV